MKNILRFAVYVLFCYAAFALSGAVYSFFDTIFNVYTVDWPTSLQASLVPSLPGWISMAASCSISACAARARRAGVDPGVSWLVVIGPFLLLFFVERGICSHCLSPACSTIRCRWSSSASPLSPALSPSTT